MNNQNPLYDNVPDEELGPLLYQILVIDGHSECEIHHPTEGKKTVTKENYRKTLSEITKINKMSPSERIIEHKRIKDQHQKKHYSDMSKAKFHIVDIEDEKGFGYDISGSKIDMEGLVFIGVNDYLKTIIIKENEIGAFIHLANEKKPVRILTIKTIE